MRTIIMICVGLLVAYWADQTWNGGTYSRALPRMLGEIRANYK
jgi:hypothetical protein